MELVALIRAHDARSSRVADRREQDLGGALDPENAKLRPNGIGFT